jgi:hypothetical protein
MIAFPNQGHKIALGWNNANLKNFTAYYVDGKPLPPPNDRNGYTDGVAREMPSGAILMAGVPVDRLVFPRLSYPQVNFLYTTFHNQNVTVEIHKPISEDKEDTFTYNAVATIELNQFQNLQTRYNGYEGVEMRLVLWEPL